MPNKNLLPSSNNNSSVPESRQQSDITFVDIQQSCCSSSTTHELNMCISSVSSEKVRPSNSKKTERIQLQEIQKSSKAIH